MIDSTKTKVNTKVNPNGITYGAVLVKPPCDQKPTEGTESESTELVDTQVSWCPEESAKQEATIHRILSAQ